MPSSHRFCDYCGAANRLEARFCVSCGSPVQVVAASSSSAAGHNGMLTGKLAPQTLLGQRYRIRKLIGQGGMGAVYLAEDLHFSGALRAVKELSQQGLSPQEAQEAARAFKHEADLLAHLVHPNLPRIYDHFDEQGRWYLTMDYIAGETLEQRLGRLPQHIMEPRAALDVALQLCESLHYLHSQQPPIIFRDLKPANIMLTPDDHVYLIDFGIARFFKPGQATDTVALGSPGYAAPEQYGKAQTTASADIYSLGATLHQILSGSDPSLDPFQFAELDLSSQPSGDELEALVLQMVEIKRDKRPASMLEVKQRLQTILHLLAAKATPGSPLAVPLTTAILPNPLTVQGQANGNAAKTLVVDQAGTGDYCTLGKAVEELRRDAGRHKGRPLLLVYPGVYCECVTLDLGVEIRGVGAAEEIILENTDDSCLVVQAEDVSIYGLTLRSYVKQNEDDFYTVDIREGEALLEDCFLTGEARACIGIYGNTSNPMLRRCKIYEGHQNGILVSQAAHVSVEDCEIYGNTSSQVCIREEADASIRRCKIYGGKDCGIMASQKGKGTLENCAIFENARHGVALTTEGNLLLRDCAIHGNKDGGVASLEHGEGTLEQCDIFANARLGIGVILWGRLKASGCKIHENGSAGIHIYEYGEGEFKNCAVFQNTTLGIAVKQGGKPYVLDCDIHHNGDAGIAVVEHGGGTFEDCRIYANTKPGVGISSQGMPVLRRCTVQRNGDAGIHIYEGGQGRIEDCDLSSNQRIGLVVSGRSRPVVQRCEIHHNNHGGVHVHQDGGGTFVGCDIYSNRLSNFTVSNGASPEVNECKLHSSIQNGLYICNHGRGIFERCDIFDNVLSGIELKTGAAPIIRGCQIYNNHQYGIRAYDNGRGVIERCNVYGNTRGSWDTHAGGYVVRL